MANNKVTVFDILKQFSLHSLCSTETGLNRNIEVADLSRPGIEITGYFNFYPAERVQLLGKTELSYLANLTGEEKKDRFDKLGRKETPCFIITRGQSAPEELIEMACLRDIPVLSTDLPTTRIGSMLTNYLEHRLAPTTLVHGVLIDVSGIGVLITGKSGVGKSETGLALIKRGHRLVADDAVEIRKNPDLTLVGSAPPLIRNLIELRGIGIVNVMTLFGAESVRPMKKITIVINLEMWDEKKQYDRLGLDEENIEILGVKLPLFNIPVRPGRNLASLIEVAAMNHRVKRMGHHAALDFSNRLNEVLEDSED